MKTRFETELELQRLVGRPPTVSEILFRSEEGWVFRKLSGGETLAPYVSNPESSAYGTNDVANLNALRVAYENLRVSYEDLRSKLIAAGVVDE